jgi:hypothetical protein
LEKDLPQPDRRDFDGAGVEIASPLHDRIRVSASEDSHLMSADPNAFHSRDLKLALVGEARENNVNLPIGLAQIVERGIQD